MANPTTRLLWWALVVSQVAYLAVAYLVKLPPGDDDLIRILALSFALLSAATAAGSILYRRVALVGPIRSWTLDPSNPEDFQKLYPRLLLNLVLAESVGIHGLVLSLMSGRVHFSLAFGTAALALLYVHRPTALDLVPPLGGPRAGLGGEPPARPW